MTISEEMLGAYVDGELTAAERAQVEAAIAADLQVSQRIETLRAVRNRLLAGFSATIEEAVPQRLLDTLDAAPAVTDLEQARAARKAGSIRWAGPEWGAIAASLLVAVVLGYFLLRSPVPGLLVKREGQLLAQNALAETLSNQLAGDQGSSSIRVGISFRDKQGAYCRTFTLPDRAGLACRENGQWRVPVLVRSAEGQESGARQAGSPLPPEILRAVEDRIAGEPLDAADEVAARQSNWGTR